MARRIHAGLLALLLSVCAGLASAQLTVQTYPVPKGTHPHDVAPAPDRSVLHATRGQGALGLMDPATGGMVLCQERLTDFVSRCCIRDEGGPLEVGRQ